VYLNKRDRQMSRPTSPRKGCVRKDIRRPRLSFFRFKCQTAHSLDDEAHNNQKKTASRFRPERPWSIFQVVFAPRISRRPSFKRRRWRRRRRFVHIGVVRSICQQQRRKTFKLFSLPRGNRVFPSVPPRSGSLTPHSSHFKRRILGLALAASWGLRLFALLSSRMVRQSRGPARPFRLVVD
jgi:hypothetical protein